MCYVSDFTLFVSTIEKNQIYKISLELVSFETLVNQLFMAHYFM